MNPKARRVLPRDAPSYFTWFLGKFSGLPISYFTLVAYVLPLAHTRARGSVLSLSIGGGVLETTPPSDAATGPAARCPPVCQGPSFPIGAWRLRRETQV